MNTIPDADYPSAQFSIIFLVTREILGSLRAVQALPKKGTKKKKKTSYIKTTELRTLIWPLVALPGTFQAGRQGVRSILLIWHLTSEFLLFYNNPISSIPSSCISSIYLSLLYVHPLISSYVISSHLILFHLTSLIHLISSHLTWFISSHLTSFHLTSFY